MGRSPSRNESGLKKGPWTAEEDQKLVQYIQEHGLGSWRALPKLAGLNRCGKSCRLRWTNYLRPDIKRGKFSQEEEQTILHLHASLGNKWSAIATHLPGRTDNKIKNFWNTQLKKKLIKMGFDPMTHRPRTDFLANLPQLIALANLLERDPLEGHALRLQAEAMRIARLPYLKYILDQPEAQNLTLNSSYNIHEMGNSFNKLPELILPIKENPLLSSSYLENEVPFSNLLHQPINTSSPLIDTQVPFMFQTHLNSDMDQACNLTMGDILTSSSWVQSPSTSSVLQAMAETNSVNNPGDVISSSSYRGGASYYWPEFHFGDPHLHEIS